MESIEQLFKEKNKLICEGRFAAAAELFLADDVVSLSADRSVTGNKNERIKKNRSIPQRYSNIRGITLHHSAIAGNISFAEFTYHFDMRDGTSYHMHEVTRSVWKDGLVVEEQYFRGN